MTDTEKFIQIFREISSIPRCSGNERQIANWLIKRAESQKFNWSTDSAGNISIKVSSGSDKTLVFQNHMDMVCEKDNNSAHDFHMDPIKIVKAGKWLKADGTTLGADNGAGMAIALLLAESDISKPNLELLFTVDEERGLVGANNLGKNMITGNMLINLDTEVEGEIIIGCAGGRDTLVQKNIDSFEHANSKNKFFIEVSGLQGGHSGLDINKNRANAIKILGQALSYIEKKSRIKLIKIEGGNAHNAIPRYAYAEFLMEDHMTYEDMKKIVSNLETKNYISIGRLQDESSQNIIPAEHSKEILKFINDVPHGVYSYVPEIEDKVEASSNLAVVTMRNGFVEFLISQRSSDTKKMDQLTSKIENAAKNANMSFTTGNEYPGWKPDTSSELLKTVQDTYRDIFHKEIKVDIVHAGLECGIIKEKFNWLDIVSLGPTIENAHSPQERLDIKSVEKILHLLQDALKKLA